MPKTLPLDSEYPDDSFTVVLDGELFGLRALWNARLEIWSLELQSSQGESLLVEPVRASLPIFEAPRTGAPGGLFLVVDTSKQDMDPGRDELGERVVVVYFSKDEIS